MFSVLFNYYAEGPLLWADIDTEASTRERSGGFKFELILGLNYYSNRKTLYSFCGFAIENIKE